MLRNRLFSLVSVLVIAVIAFLAGVAVCYPGASAEGYQRGYSSSSAAIREKLVKRGIIPAEKVEIKTISGKVISSDGQSLTIKVDGNVSSDPFAEEGPSERVVTASSGAKIELMAPYSPEERKKLDDALLESIKSGKPVPLIDAYKRSEIKLSDIKPGMTVAVTSESDIASAARISASKMSVVVQ